MLKDEQKQNLINFNLQLTEAVIQRCSVKKVLLEISQNSQENTCVRISFFNKAASLLFIILIFTLSFYSSIIILFTFTFFNI